MPTYEKESRFLRDWDRLTPAQQEQFKVAVVKFIAGLRSGHFLPGLRVKGVQGHPNVYEMTWASDGRATFRYGDPVHEGDSHIIWQRIGGHEIFDQP